MASLWCGRCRFIVGRKLNWMKLRPRRLSSEININNHEYNEEEAKEAKESKSDFDSDRKKFKVHCGKYANLADGCAVVELGGTAVMATVVGKGEPTGLDIPLTVTYQQKAAAIGRIPTNFLRKELGITDNEVLVSRVIDRSLRPLFQPGLAIETQVICNPLALDGSNFPEVIAINAASAALAVSDIPWLGPVAATRVALIDNEIVLNPTKLEFAKSSLNVIVTITKNNLIVMIEGSCDNVLFQDFQKCMRMAVKNCRQTLSVIHLMLAKHKKEKRELKPYEIPSDLMQSIKTETEEQLKKILKDHTYDKLSRDKAIKEVADNCLASITTQHPSMEGNVFRSAFHLYLKELYKALVFETNTRCDGRSKTDIRNIECEIDLYKALHGSSVFKRGQTQVFCTVALDSPSAAMRMDKVSMLVSGFKEKNFFVHYEFPPFATGEIGLLNRRNRREVGHGNLAENALKYSIPNSYPFTIRLTSEVLESNGSSSMATVCGGTLALLDAGVPLRYEVAGVAMGLLTNNHDVISDCLILTDIMGMEDYLGDMDFKIAGTKTGLTAFQLDVKVPGLPLNIVYMAVVQAKKAITQIFRSMDNAISKPREDKKENQPVMKVITVPSHVRSKFIGLGGANIKKLELEIGIEITEIGEGKFSVFAVNQSAMDEALAKINEVLEAKKSVELEFGAIYTVTVVEIKNNGCLVQLNPNSPPEFISLSQLDVRQVSHPSALNIEVGSVFQVKYFGRDPVSGNIRLSRKVLFPKSNN